VLTEWSAYARRTNLQRGSRSTCVCHGTTTWCGPASLHARKGAGELHISLTQSTIMAVGALTCVGAILILFPQTFFAANVISAAVVLYLAAVQSKAHNIKGAFIELPFVLLPLLVLYLGYPFKHQQ
jgi:hypothetical protein